MLGWLILCAEKLFTRLGKWLARKDQATFVRALNTTTKDITLEGDELSSDWKELLERLMFETNRATAIGIPQILDSSEYGRKLKEQLQSPELVFSMSAGLSMMTFVRERKAREAAALLDRLVQGIDLSEPSPSMHPLIDGEKKRILFKMLGLTRSELRRLVMECQATVKYDGPGAVVDLMKLAGEKVRAIGAMLQVLDMVELELHRFYPDEVQRTVQPLRASFRKVA